MSLKGVTKFDHSYTCMKIINFQIILNTAIVIPSSGKKSPGGKNKGLYIYILSNVSTAGNFRLSFDLESVTEQSWRAPVMHQGQSPLVSLVWSFHFQKWSAYWYVYFYQ